MAQTVKLIDISRSYIPIDPNSFPESMHSTQAEDAPEGRIPVVPYDGYNFMPTAYGYMSYFGINSILNVNPLTGLTTPFALLNVDDVFVVQGLTLQNTMVALCEDGIYTKYAASTGAWDKVIALTVPASGVHKNYTYCVIGNEVYIYRAGELNVWVMRAAEDFVPTVLTPSSNLNMPAQQGIFKAGGRLGIWDSANSIAWSDIDDKMDFVPDLETGVGAAIFQHIVGKITVCLQHGNGFMVYCTRSIVHVKRNADANFLWASETVFNENGLSYLGQATTGQPDTTHFAYTTFGLIKIENGIAEYIIPEVFSYLKETRDPIFVRVLEGRYLFLEFINANYVLGIPNFSYVSVPSTTFTFKGASYNIAHIEDNPCLALGSIDSSFEENYLYTTYGYTSYTQAVSPGQVPIWEDILSTGVPAATLLSWKTYGSGSFGDSLYFSSVAFANGGITKIDGSGTEFFIPATSVNMPLVAGFAADETTEENTDDFYAKQDFLWMYEAAFQESWKKAILDKVHAPITIEGVMDLGTVPASGIQSFGPYLDLSFFSEANKWYGQAEKSAWLQRSLTKGFYVDIPVNYDISYSTPILMTTTADYGGSLPSPAYVGDFFNGHLSGLGTTISGLSGPASCGACSTFYFTVMVGTGITQVWYSSVGIPPGPAYEPDGSPGTSPKCCRIDFGAKRADNDEDITALMAPYAGNPFPPDTYAIVTQTFGQPVFRPVDFETCVYQELGYTHIKGHGHYDLLGNFFVDDSTPEAPDYEDICLTNPAKIRQAHVMGVPIGTGTGQACVAQEVTILSELFTYPDQTITLPPSSFLMQDGSIEPIYPTYQGAFVYDLQYKKWGKCGQPFKRLLNYSPINSVAGDRPIPADIFSVSAGCLLDDGTLALFDKYPADSIIKIGKIGYFRKGFTDCEEVRIQFRNLATGNVTVEGSLDGKNIEPAISQTRSYTDVNEVTEYFSNSARWFNIVINGIYDIKNLDFNGHKKGKR